MINQLFTFLIRLPLQRTDLIVINDAAYYAYRFFSVVSRYRLAIGLYTVDGDKLALLVEVVAYNVVLGSDYTKRGCRKS